MKTIIASLSYCALLLSASVQAKDYSDALEPSTDEIVVASYNVQNLFNAEHDRDEDGFERVDWEFTPRNLYDRNGRRTGQNRAKVQGCKKAGKKYLHFCLNTDWTERKIDLKIGQIKSVLQSLKQDQSMPDILALMEVENEYYLRNSIVARLARELGYRSYRIALSPDVRGVSVAVLYKESANLKYLESREISVEANKPTRDILEVKFQIFGAKPLYVYANHWPSQAAPTAIRVNVARTLRQIVDSRQQEEQAAILAVGDFNVLPRERPNPISSILLDPDGSAPLHDLTDYYQPTGSQPEGSYYYARDHAWNKLDRMIVSDDLLNGDSPRIDPSSFTIWAPKFIQKRLGGEWVPKRYNTNGTNPDQAGFSDHFPIRAVITR